MIEILTLLAGLLVGPQQVELAVSPAATAVEVRLDGEVAERLDRPPWRFTLDLGESLAPHRVEIVSRSAAGLTVDREELWINQPPGGPVAPSGRGGDVHFVVEPSAQAALGKLAEERKTFLRNRGQRQWDRPSAMLQMGAGFRYLVYFAGSDELPASAENDLFASYRELPAKSDEGEGLSHLLTHWWPQATPPRVADAVAVAAWEAVHEPRPRAVVLLTSGEEDASLLAPAEVRGYLAALGVPFAVWTPWPAELTGPLDERWGEVVSVYDWGRFEESYAALTASLAAQRTAAEETP